MNVVKRRIAFGEDLTPLTNGDRPAGALIVSIRKPKVSDRVFMSDLMNGDSADIPPAIVERYVTKVEAADESSRAAAAAGGLELPWTPAAGIEDLDWWITTEINELVMPLAGIPGGDHAGESERPPATSSSAGSSAKSR